MAGGWQFRQSFLAPLAVNVATALILFLSVVLLKERVYDLLRPDPKSQFYPLVCFVEAYMEEETQRAHLYIANLDNAALKHADLQRRVGLASIEEGVSIDPDIRVSWTRRQAGILDIVADEPFNGDKGELTIFSPEAPGGEWRIRVNWIRPRKMLRVRIVTDYEREIDPASPLYPYEIEYPGL